MSTGFTGETWILLLSCPKSWGCFLQGVFFKDAKGKENTSSLAVWSISVQDHQFNHWNYWKFDARVSEEPQRNPFGFVGLCREVHPKLLSGFPPLWKNLSQNFKGSLWMCPPNQLLEPHTLDFPSPFLSPPCLAPCWVNSPPSELPSPFIPLLMS